MFSSKTPKPEEGAELETDAAQEVEASEEEQPLDDQLAQLQAERDDFHSKYLRATADFQNYQRRAIQNEQEARLQGKSAVIQSILSAMDHFEAALNQDTSSATADQIIQGVSSIRDEMLRALAMQGVQTINPARNDEFDASQHEAMVQQPDPEVDPGNVVMTYQVGYILDGRVLRPAKVVVAPGVEDQPQEQTDADV